MNKGDIVRKTYTDICCPFMAVFFIINIENALKSLGKNTKTAKSALFLKKVAEKFAGVRK